MKNLHSLLILTIILGGLLIACDEDDPQIKITSISFNSASVEVVEGTTVNLNDILTIEGEDADQAEITFSSVDEEVVTVSGNTLTAAGVGQTTVEATETNTNQTATIDVTVIANTVAVTGVALDKETADLKVGETLQLTATVSPDDATEPGVIWSVDFPSGSKTQEDSPTDIATVSEAGLVTAVAAGDVVVTAKTKDGDFTASVDISITNVAVTGVSISPETISIAGNTTLQLEANVAPENAFDKSVTWSLSLEEMPGDEISIGIAIAIDASYYAEINEETGLITSKRPCDNCGLMAKVTTTDGSFTDEKSVEITYVAVSGITLDPTSFTVDPDATQQLTATVTPENASYPGISWSVAYPSNLCDVPPVSNYASVDENGLVSGIAAFSACGGIDAIATSDDNGSITATSNFSVNTIEVTSLTIVDSDGLAYAGKAVELDYCTFTEYQLYTNILPANASDKTVTWSMTSGMGANVNSSTGLLSLDMYGGTARITVTANDGSGQTDYIDVTVDPCI